MTHRVAPQQALGTHGINRLLELGHLVCSETDAVTRSELRKGTTMSSRQGGFRPSNLGRNIVDDQIIFNMIEIFLNG